MNLSPVYLRKAPSTDPVLKQYWPNARKTDVLVFEDAAGQKLKATFRWDSSRRPNRRTRTVMLNCFPWRVVWLPD